MVLSAPLGVVSPMRRTRSTEGGSGMEGDARARRTPRRIVTLIATAGLVAGLLAGLAPAQIANAGTTHNFLIVYAGSTVSPASVDAIRSAGGTIVTTYRQIGVALASSSTTTFAANLERRDPKVIGVSATGAFATKLNDGAQGGSGSDAVPTTPATDGDSLSGLQWDMVQIHTPEAHAITAGSSLVVVGDIDTGLDWTHPDLAPNVDFADSASCIGGVADNSPGAWLDDNGHGTHT